VGVGEPAPSDLDVRRALEALSPQQRAVVFLVYWEDKPIPQVARLLDVSQGTVRKQLDRAKAKLKRVLDG
jgi:RNA polymerase sigma-70 factor (ECF subfamily)